MKKFHIAIICDSIDSTLGGSYISAQRFARWLAQQWHHIIRCTSRFIESSRKKDFSYAKLYEFPSSFPIWPQHVRFAYAPIPRLVEIFEKENIDIVYNIHPALIGRQAYRAAKKLHIPIVSHSHIYAELLAPGLPRFFQGRIKKAIARFYKKCDGIIYPTAFAKKDFESFHFKNKEAVISNGVDTALFHPGKMHTHANFNILFVGRLDPEKNIHILFEALNELKLQHKIDNHVQCTIVGSWSEERKLHSLAEKYYLRDIVDFTGKIAAASPQLVQIYQNASVYVLTSFYELESMTTLEAMACSCPILIADSNYSAAKFFVHDNGYLFHPHDPKDLAEKLYQLSKNPTLLDTMSKKSIEYSINYSFKKSVEQLESFFLSFCIVSFKK